MLREQRQCDLVVMSRFLSDQLSADEQHAFEEHLESCKRCRDKLAAVAAEQGLWSEVRETLGSEVSLRLSPEASVLSSIEPTDGQDEVSACDAVLALLKPTDHPNMLGRFGGYEIVAVIGRGGMGVVLKGFEPSLNRFVAIKVLAPHLATSGAARKRFSREAQAAASVLHENVIAIHAVSEDNDHPYLVMPYERGPSLQKRLEESGPLSVVEVLRIGMQAAAGLAAAHAQGIVHRDIKPGNILLDEGVERIKLTDFGLARAADDASLTKTGVIAGTPQFMSPEQARGETIAVTSDLFSLGSVLYTMCTGRPPFRAETSYGILRRITDTEPRPIREINPDAPEWLCAIIARLMAKRPGGRFESAGEVAELLEECLAHVQQPANAPLSASLAAQTSSSRLTLISPRSFGVVTMFTTLGLVLLGLFLWYGSDAPGNVGNKLEQGKPTAEASSQSEELEYARAGNDVQSDRATSKPITYSKNFAGKQWKDVFQWLAALTDCTVNDRVSTEFEFTYRSPCELTLAQLLRFIHVQALKDELLLVFDEAGESFRVEVAYERFRRAEPERQVGRRVGDFFKVVEYRLEPSNHYPDGLAPPALVYRLEALRDFSASELRSALETSFREGEFTQVSDGKLVDAEGWHVGPTTASPLPSLRKGRTIRLWVSWGVFYKGNFVSAVKPGPRSYVRSEDLDEVPLHLRANNAMEPSPQRQDRKQQPYKKQFVVAFSNPDEIGTLNVDIKRGSIDVTGYDGDKVIVQLTVPNYSPSANQSREGLKELRPNTLDFEIEKSKKQIKVDGNSYEYITNLYIKVPRATNLTLDSYRDGEIDVRQVEGFFNVRSQNNDIHLVNVSGSARLWAYNGDLAASFESVAKERPLYFESYNGSIDLMLPVDTKANARYRSGSGKVLTDFEITLSNDVVQTVGDGKIEFDDFVHGTLNGGGPLLTLATEKGDIRLRKRMKASIRSR